MDIINNHKQNGSYMLEFDNVVLKAGDKTILDNVSFNTSYSNIVLIKGAIGSGKSTILKTLAGVNKLEQGSILNKFHNEPVGAVYIHSQPELNFLTGYIKDELDMLGIEDYTPFKEYLNKSVYELNGGALKKISLLMALHISNNRVILADEPLDMLDDIQAENLSKIIIEYSKKVPFIIATHDIHFDEYADTVITL